MNELCSKWSISALWQYYSTQALRIDLSVMSSWLSYNTQRFFPFMSAYSIPILKCVCNRRGGVGWNSFRRREYTTGVHTIDFQSKRTILCAIVLLNGLLNNVLVIPILPRKQNMLKRLREYILDIASHTPIYLSVKMSNERTLKERCMSFSFCCFLLSAIVSLAWGKT